LSREEQQSSFAEIVFITKTYNLHTASLLTRIALNICEKEISLIVSMETLKWPNGKQSNQDKEIPVQRDMQMKALRFT